MKVGDYVRYNGKIYKISEIGYVNNKPFSFMSNEDGWFMLEDSKTSPNIIDLIEVGDYVDKLRVVDKEEYYIVVETFDERIFITKEDTIKSIVTKEQFESMEYKI